ncbi:MAG: putative toxin-antitoxin system toxin component, PIN family [Alphaproteobacteria bacterium]|jgi:putative PIN family toxin of toxin-antitoxin system|nr:putative toxin-antitoxin system toxin component, PIN family [Alphaproteobacteria bacterium]
MMGFRHNHSLSAVIDTGVFVSAALRKGSAPRQLTDFFIKNGKVVFSHQTLHELSSVLFRPKFDHLVTLAVRQEFLIGILSSANLCIVQEHVSICRDPKDDIFLSTALAGCVDIIVSGDKDLLVLHPFRNIPILSPSQFLQEIFSLDKG